MPSLDFLVKFVPFHSSSFIYELVTLVGFNLLIWGSVGLVRLAVEIFARIRGLKMLVRKLIPQRSTTRTLTKNDVAIIMAAYNEELVIAKSIRSLLVLVPPQNIYIISDGSKDNTAEIARSFGVNVLEPENSGKAGALKRGIDHFQLAQRYTGVLFVDADTIISPTYLDYALPYLEDDRVAVVAGFAKTLWEPATTGFWNMFILAHRERVYILVQYLIKYAQAWLGVSVTPIIPGFCSLYRASVLPSIDIAAKGLVIEDYNMTFEVHRKRLGKIIMDPRVYGNTQDPDNLRDYYKQVRRWHLGFWQTLKLHGFWPSLFSAALLLYSAEVLLSTLSLVLLPAVLVFIGVVAVLGVGNVSPWVYDLYTIFTQEYGILKGLLLLFAIDYAVSIIVALLFRRPQYLWYGLGFLFMKYIDAWTFLAAFPRTFLVHSTGAWVSPTRRTIATNT